MATIRCQSQVFTDIHAVILDKDGTLAQSESYLRSLAQRRARLVDAQIPGVQEPLLMAFGVNGNRLDPVGLMAVGSRTESEIATAAYIAETGRGWAEALQIARAAFQEAEKQTTSLPKAEQTPLMPGALEFSQRLRQAGVRLAILSSDREENVAEFVQTLGLSSYFQVARGVNAQVVDKTDPQLLQLLIDALSLPTQPLLPAQVLMIGDSQIDAQIAADAKLAGCIGFVGGWQMRPAIPNATVLAERFSQIEVL